MADNPPWANDPIIGAATPADMLNRPVIQQGEKPTPPTEQYHPMTPQERSALGLAAGVPAVMSGSGKPDVVNVPDKTSYRAMSSDEKKTAGLDETQPYFIGDNGLPTLPQGAKSGAAPVDTEAARAHVSTILQSIDQASKLLDAPLTSGLPGSLFGHVPGTNAYALRSLIGDTNDPNNPGQITGDLRQQGISYLRALNGGNGVGTVARSQQEQQALQSAMSNIRQGLPADQLKTALGNVKQIYLRAYARSYGLDPENPQVQHQFGIDPNYQLPGVSTQTTPAPQGTAKDNGITASNPPPAIGVNGGQQAAVSSGDAQAVTNPQLARIAPKLQQYLAADPSKVSNAMILGFMQKNGVNPAETSIMPALQYRTSKDGAAWRASGGGYSIDPTYSAPLHGFRKAAAAVSGSTPGALVAGAADTASLGAAPDVAGVVNAVTGAGPTRAEAMQARDALAGNSPTATLIGNLIGGVMPLSGAGEASALSRTARAAGGGGAYGFFGSDKSDIQDRLFNSGLGALLAAGGHVATDVGGRLAGAGYRTASRPIESFINPEAAADKYALNAAARKMPTQSLNNVEAADIAATKAGVPAPAAASINRGGQDFLARAASGSPAARAVADQVSENARKAIPQELAGDFNSAIEAASPRGVDASTYLNRPVRDIAKDVQGMAGREYESGLAPIAKEKLTITPEIADSLDHERISGAIRDALANHNLDADTRDQLRQLIPQLKSLNSAPEMARDAYAKGIPLSVDGARNIATALDRTANRLADGSEGQVELSRLSRDIRGAIGEQFPEYGPVNERYASRMRAIGAMHDARRNFFASTPDQIDALNKASGKFTDTANEGERGVENAAPLPSNRQYAMAGAREAAQVKAGEQGGATAQRLSGNVNQQANNATVLGSGAQGVQAKAGQRAVNAEAVDRVASGGTGDQTERWFDTAKRLVALKATGGTAHYALAHAASSIPGFSSQDAARVVRLYLDADKAPQVLQSLTSAYGTRRARFIMARMAAMSASASGVRGFPQPSQ